MARSLKKGPTVDHSLWFKPFDKKKPIKTWSRKSLILPEFVNQKFQVHNGLRFITVTVTEDMIGHKLGEFAVTRKKCIHKDTQKK